MSIYKGSALSECRMEIWRVSTWTLEDRPSCLTGAGTCGFCPLRYLFGMLYFCISSQVSSQVIRAIPCDLPKGVTGIVYDCGIFFRQKRLYIENKVKRSAN